MKTSYEFEVGDIVNANTHCYNNERGGTEYGGKITARVSKAWHDYETGWRYIGNTVGGQRVYFGEFDGLSIAKPKARKTKKPVSYGGTIDGAANLREHGYFGKKAQQSS